MRALTTTAAAPPGPQARGERTAVPNPYFAIAVDSVVDLLEAREHGELPRAERRPGRSRNSRASLKG